MKVVLALEKIADKLVELVNKGVNDLSVGKPEVCAFLLPPPVVHYCLICKESLGVQVPSMRAEQCRQMVALLAGSNPML